MSFVNSSCCCVGICLKLSLSDLSQPSFSLPSVVCQLFTPPQGHVTCDLLSSCLGFPALDLLLSAARHIAHVGKQLVLAAFVHYNGISEMAMHRLHTLGPKCPTLTVDS